MRFNPFFSRILLCSWFSTVGLELARSQDSYTSPDAFFIKCGAKAHTSSYDRVWQGDSLVSGLLSSSLQDSILASSSNSTIEPFLNTVYIFTKRGSYGFRICSPGRRSIRLYFYPFTFKNFNSSSVKFSIVAGDLPSIQALSHLSMFHSWAWSIVGRGALPSKNTQE
ncbi:hypothetical protein KP509_1Z037700 [Ceratopteris richardii]|nr:hypothetical protein KP509_1Z037700 [Ceratopteris richardii]